MLVEFHDQNGHRVHVIYWFSATAMKNTVTIETGKAALKCKWKQGISSKSSNTDQYKQHWGEPNSKLQRYQMGKEHDTSIGADTQTYKAKDGEAVPQSHSLWDFNRTD